MKELRFGVLGLISGCLVSGVILITLITCLFYYWPSIPITIPMRAELGESVEFKKILSFFVSVILPAIFFVAIWFFGIFFSTFARALAENVRNYVVQNRKD